MNGRWHLRALAAAAAADGADMVLNVIVRETWWWWTILCWQACAVLCIVAYLYQAKTIRLLRETVSWKDQTIALLQEKVRRALARPWN